MSARLSEDTASTRQAVACGGKTAWPNPHAAERKAKSMRRRHDERFVTYRCRFCRAWHIGSQERWQD